MMTLLVPFSFQYVIVDDSAESPVGGSGIILGLMGVFIRF